MNCPKCGLENPNDALFCMRCGKELSTGPVEAPEEAKPCYRHPKVTTQLSCGRCERPICTKCVVLGPAGPRCRDCAKLTIEARPAAVLHTIKTGFASLFRAGPWTIYVWILLLSVLFGGARGCMGMLEEQRIQQRMREAPPE